MKYVVSYMYDEIFVVTRAPQLIAQIGKSLASRVGLKALLEVQRWR